jgi:Icc-related predicted phosphoesterase
MRILVLADVHGEFRKTDAVIDKAKASNPDIVICPGDFTDMFNVPEGFSQTDMADVVLQKILSLGKPTFAVPGNHDPYEVVELFNEYGVNLHSAVRDAGDLFLVGWGGAPTPFNTIIEPTEDETREELSRLGGALGNRTFGLVVHNPPKDTKMDRTGAGKHVGSDAIKEFILARRPLFAVSAHIHEARGTDMLGSTVLFYPGPVYEGFYGIMETGGGKVACAIKKA